MPCAKIVGNETFSIINDYTGRPIQAYDNNGNLVWSCDYDIYGGLRNLKGDREFIPFRQLGQYEDVETGLYYNRFRYYNPETGLYISKDPIGLAGGFALYAYVKDVNSFVDVFGLSRRGNQATRDHIELVKRKFMEDNPGSEHIGGGLKDDLTPMKEVYIKAKNPVSGSTKGASYADLTFKTSEGNIVHINTVDKGNFNGMSSREFTNLNKMKANDPTATVLSVVKGETPTDLKICK